MIQLSASDFYTYHQPSLCECRIYHRHNGIPEEPPGPYEQVLFRFGKTHEQNHCRTIPNLIDLSKGTRAERERLTLEALAKGNSAIYQAALSTQTKLAGNDVTVLGEPDFLIPESGFYKVRDSKLSRRINEKDHHPEIILQVQLYGWLLERAFRKSPHSLEVHSGTGEIIGIPYHGKDTVLDALEKILQMKLLKEKPYSPVGWTKCHGCGFFSNCWSVAEQSQDVALINGVDQGLAIALHEAGFHTAKDLLSNFSEVTLADFQRPWGKKTQRVGKKAGSILRMTQALITKKEIFIQPPNVPQYPNYAMFDLEGLPPHLDELEKIYLWGLQVFGDDPSDFIAATADFGPEGDQEGWKQFLKNAKDVFQRYGDLPFVHWHHYERVRLDQYVGRYGDREGIAARVNSNLFDLLPATQQCVALPLPSYSLKVVEGYVGYQRTLDEYGGDWAMAKYIEATETNDEAQRKEVMDQILQYNKEDLEATWAVFQWLKSKSLIRGFH